MQVLVRDNNIDQALRVLKKKMQREGMFREMKQRRSYEKPSERKNREKAEAIRRTQEEADGRQEEGDGPAAGNGRRSWWRRNGRSGPAAAILAADRVEAAR